MTVFITHYLKRLISLSLLSLCLTTTALAQQNVELVSLAVEPQEDVVVLNAAVKFELNRTLEDALNKGAPLYFVAEASVVRSRWYWLDETVIETSRTVRIAYEPLLRRYRVSTGGLMQTVDTITEALSLAQRGIRMRLGDRNAFRADERYRAEFSYRLDTAKLPRVFQVGLTAPRDFALELPARRIAFKGEEVRRTEPMPAAIPATPSKESLKEPPR
jgi:Domain of unknown function (DUF4390)